MGTSTKRRRCREGHSCLGQAEKIESCHAPPCAQVTSLLNTFEYIYFCSGVPGLEPPSAPKLADSEWSNKPGDVEGLVLVLAIGNWSVHVMLDGVPPHLPRSNLQLPPQLRPRPQPLQPAPRRLPPHQPPPPRRFVFIWITLYPFCIF
jgi:hypothetical protein